MLVTKVGIYCDTPDCESACENCPTAADALRQARADGWKLRIPRNGGDKCRDCLRAEQQTRSAEKQA